MIQSMVFCYNRRNAPKPLKRFDIFSEFFYLRIGVKFVQIYLWVLISFSFKTFYSYIEHGKEYNDRIFSPTMWNYEHTHITSTNFY